VSVEQKHDTGVLGLIGTRFKSLYDALVRKAIWCNNCTWRGTGLLCRVWWLLGRYWWRLVNYKWAILSWRVSQKFWFILTIVSKRLYVLNFWWLVWDQMS